MTTIQVRVPEKLLAQIKREAKLLSDGSVGAVSASDLVRHAVEQFLSQQSRRRVRKLTR